MLENSGLVLGVDSSLGLLTRLHYPRHVSVTLLDVHGRLLHLEEGERERERPGQLSRSGFSGQVRTSSAQVLVKDASR